LPLQVKIKLRGRRRFGRRGLRGGRLCSAAFGGRTRRGHRSGFSRARRRGRIHHRRVILGRRLRG